MPNMKDYVAVTTVSTHRMRYVIHKDDLQAKNPETPVEPIVWAKDSVTCEELEEFSQDWLGEQIVDAQTMTEDEMLELFDKDNDYLKEWSKEKKIQWVRDLKERSF